MAPHWRVVRHPAVESKHKMPESISHENEIESGTQARHQLERAHEQSERA
jgi:hypothetical protein